MTAYIWQSANFLRGTVKANVEFPLRIRGIEKKERDEIVNDGLEKFNLSEFKNKLTHKLSGGQKQKVALLRGLIYKPKVIILDEATNNLDAETSKWLENYLLEYKKNNNIIIIWITHDIFEASRLGEQTLVLSKGKIIASGKFQDIMKTEKMKNFTEFLRLRYP